jgi:hypothetical protein
MTRAQKKAMLTAIARIAERAYRRGFQHGTCAARGELGAPAPTPMRVVRWRFSKIGRTAISPPGSDHFRTSLLDRLAMELPHGDPIQDLFQTAEQKA